VSQWDATFADCRCGAMESAWIQREESVPLTVSRGIGLAAFDLSDLDNPHGVRYRRRRCSWGVLMNANPLRRYQGGMVFDSEAVVKQRKLVFHLANIR
jgi:hypothetical protein